MIVDLSNIKSGYSDKLRAITFYLAVNNLSFKKKSKKFYIYEIKTKECPFRFIDYCKIRNIKIIKLKKRKKSKINLNSYNTEITFKNVLKNNPSKLIDNYLLLDEWQKSYKKLLPGYKIESKIKKNKFPKNIIGLHIRTTDRMIKLKEIINIQFKDTMFDIQLRYFEKNIHKILKKISNSKNVFVASDSKQIKNTIVNKLKKENYKVYFNKARFRKEFRQTSGEDFLIDFFSLIKCQTILSTVGAGVTQSIMLIKKRKVINWNNQINKFILLRLFGIFLIFLKKIKNNLSRVKFALTL